MDTIEFAVQCQDASVGLDPILQRQTRRRVVGGMLASLPRPLDFPFGRRVPALALRLRRESRQIAHKRATVRGAGRLWYARHD